MSTENGPSTTAPDPNTITDELRREIHDLENDPEVLGDEPTDDERWAQAHLGELPLTYSPAVAAAVDGLLRARRLSDVGRRNALSAVNRELAARRRLRGQLPVVLRAIREDRGLTVARLSSLAGFDDVQLEALESGARPVRAEPPNTVAAWIRPLDPPHAMVIAALRRSLRAADQPLVAAGRDDQPPTDEGYVAKVLELLGWDDEES